MAQPESRTNGNGVRSKTPTSLRDSSSQKIDCSKLIEKLTQNTSRIFPTSQSNSNPFYFSFLGQQPTTQEIGGNKRCSIP